jgi:hypothetical protein
VGLDVALVDGLGAELALDHDVRLGEALLEIAPVDGKAKRHVARVLGRGLDAARAQVVVEERSVGPHGFDDVEDDGQRLVLDPDPTECLLGQRRCRGRHCRHRVAVIEHLVASEDIACEVPVVHRTLTAAALLARLLGKILGRDHRLDAREIEGGRDVDAHDPGVGVGTAEDAAVQETGREAVGSEVRAPRHLVDTVGTNGPRPHPAELPHVCHQPSPRSLAAASRTARTILS